MTQYNTRERNIAPERFTVGDS